MLTGVTRREAHASDVDTTEGTEGVAQALRDALSNDATRIIELFKEWDEDRNGYVSKKEWRKAIPRLGLDVPKAQLSADRLNQLFDEWDPDKSGRLSLAELVKKLRSGTDAGRAALQPGAAGAIDTASTTKIAVRTGLTRRGSALLTSIDLEEGSSRSVVEQLRAILSKHAVRVIDLFREWDEDGDGVVSKTEFRKAMPLLGFVAPRAQVDELFDALDPDGGGAISIDELNKALRRGADASLQMSIPRTASAVARARRNSAKLDVDTSGRGGCTPIAPPTVKFHRSDVVEEKPPPRWDASRSSNGSSSAHAINPERLSEVILADRKRERLQEAARAKGGWDVGQRPKAAMTYLEYPEHTRTEVTTRSFDELDPFDSFASTNLSHGRVARADEQRARHRELERCGWGSSGLQPYRPLGHMEAHVTPTRFMAARHLGQVRVVDPDVPEMPVGEARIHALIPGRRTSARVHQHSYAFYCIDVQPGLVLRVKVTTVRGDPDLYMCNKHTHPTHEHHTWRATGIGDDVIKVRPDHPNAVPGTYYISVYGVQESDFQLEASLVPMEIKLPQREGDQILKGMKLLQREVVKGAQQRRTLNAGGSLRVEFANELRGRGVPREAVHAAAAPVERALQAAADEAKREALASSGAARREETRTGADPARPSKRTLALRKALLPPEEMIATREAVHETLRAVRSDPSLMAEDSADVRRSRGELKPLRPKRGAPLELEWQLHPGQSWAELPRGTRLQVAASEYNQRKKGLHAQLQSMITALAERRPARYEMRMQSMKALEAVHPKLINDPKAMRHCSEAMHSAYLRRQEDERRRASLVVPASPTGSSPRRASTSPTERQESRAASRAASRAMSGSASPAGERCWVEDPFAADAAAPSSRPRSRTEPGFNLLGALDETLALLRAPPPVVASPRTWGELPTMPLGQADTM